MRSIFAIGLLFSSLVFTTSAFAGPSCNGNYLLEKTFPSGAKWQLCWEHRRREGIVYHDFFYTPPGGTEKRILNQANLAQIHVPYDDNGARYHDVSDYGLGNSYLNNLQSGDCPGGELRGEYSINMLCMLTRERNHAHAHHQGIVDQHKIGQYFEFFSVSHVGAYNYIPSWRLYDDGSIEVLMGATGSLQRYRTGSQYQANGWLLNSSNKYGVSHLHNYYWRLDFDLGTHATDDIVEEIEFINQTGNQTRIKSITPFTTEVARSIAPDRYRSWQIRDGTNSNGLGHAISYQIEPLLTGHRDHGPSYEPWTHNDFYVTVNKSCEKYASHNPQVSGCTSNLSSFVNGQSLTGADVVIWYGLSFHHIPRDEDEPKMHAHWNSFKITPRNVTVNNPLADSSGSSNTPPVLSNPGDQTNTAGESISVTLTASDVDGDILFYSAIGLPDGLNISSSGVISGTATIAGTYSVTITVSDGEATDQQTFNWEVTPHNGFVIANKIQTGDDDAEERADGSMYRYSSDLELVEEGSVQKVGLRYQNIYLPQGATITKAWIQFQADETNSDRTNLLIHAEATENSAEFSSNDGDISNRNLTNASVNWAPEPWNSVGEADDAQRTSDLATIVQEVVNQAGWQSGNALTLIISGNGKRVAESYNGDSSAAPTLHIEFESTNNNSFSQAILASEDDVEELSNGSIYLGSSDLELTQESSQQKIGLRFNNFLLPQGANITRAWIQFQTDEVSSLSTDLLIQAEDSDNAAAFTTSTGNVGNRPLVSASVNWIPTAWSIVGEASEAQQTPDIKSLLQMIVNRPNWASGNALVIVITGTGRRVVESYDGDSAGAAKLFVEYQ